MEIVEPTAKTAEKNNKTQPRSVKVDGLPEAKHYHIFCV